MHALIFLINLLIITFAKSMDNAESFNKMVSAPKFYSAIKSNKFSDVNNFFEKKIPLNLDENDKEELKKACIENIEEKAQRLSRSANESNTITVLGFVFIGFSAIGEYLKFKSDSSDKGWMTAIDVCDFSTAAMGLQCIYRGMTNYYGTQPYKDAVAIKQLLIDNKIIDELPIENGSEEV